MHRFNKAWLFSRLPDSLIVVSNGYVIHGYCFLTAAVLNFRRAFHFCLC